MSRTIDATIAIIRATSKPSCDSVAQGTREVDAGRVIRQRPSLGSCLTHDPSQTKRIRANVERSSCCDYAVTSKKRPSVALIALVSEVVVAIEIRWWRGAESNRRHYDFQSYALPTELPRH